MGSLMYPAHTSRAAADYGLNQIKLCILSFYFNFFSIHMALYCEQICGNCVYQNIKFSPREYDKKKDLGLLSVPLFL